MSMKINTYIIFRILPFYKRNPELICLLAMTGSVAVFIILTILSPENLFYFIWILVIFVIGLVVDCYFMKKETLRHKNFIKRADRYLRLIEKQKKRDEQLMWNRFYYLMSKGDNENGDNDW